MTGEAFAFGFLRLFVKIKEDSTKKRKEKKNIYINVYTLFSGINEEVKESGQSCLSC